MKRFFDIFHRGKSGFTMVEILVVVAILGILAAVIIPNIISLMNEGEEEARLTEHHNIQIAVFSMMIDAEVPQLDDSADDNPIYTLEDIHGVTATNLDTGVTYYLDDYIYGGSDTLMQAYDIALDGSVTID